LPSDLHIINSVLRAAQILDSFNPQKPVYTNTELSRKLGLNKTTVTRLLYSLEKAGFVERDPKTKEYGLTHKLYRIGSVYISQVDLHRVAMPELAKLGSFCQETVHLVILNEWKAFYLDKVESPQSIRLISSIGNTCPAYCTGVGKVLLAFLPEEELKGFFRSVELKRYTPNTICSPKELKVHLKMIKEQGYAIDDSEHEPEVRCVAAPVYGRNGSVIASISIAGPVYRMTREKMERELVQAVKSTAHTISKKLGYIEDQ